MPRRSCTCTRGDARLLAAVVRGGPQGLLRSCEIRRPPPHSSIGFPACRTHASVLAGLRSDDDHCDRRRWCRARARSARSSPVVHGELLAERALPRRGRSVDRNDHRRPELQEANAAAGGWSWSGKPIDECGRIARFRKNEEDDIAPMTAAARRLQSLTSLLAHLRERLGVDIGFVLWDGTTVPGDLGADAMALAIADEGAVAALIRRPKLDTLFNLLVSARLELRNGTLFDLMTLRPRVRSKDFRKALDKTLALAHRGAVPVRAARRAVAARRGAWRQGRPRRQRDVQQGEHPIPLRSVERVLRALSRSRDGLQLRAISPSRTTTSRARSATSST